MALAQGKETAAKLPTFIDASRLADLEAARAALQAQMAAQEPALTRFDRGETAKLISSANETQRRAEEERALAAEVRARAEALSQRFIAETAESAQVKPAAPNAPVTKVSTPAVEPRTAAVMQRAAEALVRARRDLEEATRRAEAAGQQRGSPTWQSARAEIDEARRRASEAVDQAQKAIDEQKSIGTEVAAGTPAGTPAIAPAGKTRDPRMVPPYALGGGGVER